MGNETVNQHQIPKVYMKAWCFDSKKEKVKITEKGNSEKVAKIKELTVVDYFYSRFPGSRSYTDSERALFFLQLKNYEISWNNEPMTNYSAYYPYIFEWCIQDGNGIILDNENILSEIKAKELPLRNFIEDQWNYQYESKWHKARLELKEEILYTKECSVTALRKDFLMRFLIAFDWRSATSNGLFNLVWEKAQQVLYSGVSEDEIKENEQDYIYRCKDVCSPLDLDPRHQFLLTRFTEFLNEDGILWEIYENQMKKITFIFYVATGTEKFISSDNPTFLSEDSNQENRECKYYFPICPEILLVSKPVPEKDLNKYYIERIDNREVQKFNELIKDNSDKFIILPPEP